MSAIYCLNIVGWGHELVGTSLGSRTQGDRLSQTSMEGRGRRPETAKKIKNVVGCL